MKSNKGLRHGRKDQFSILLERDLADRALIWGDENHFYKLSHLFEKLITLGLNAAEGQNDLAETKYQIYEKGFKKCFDLVKANTKSKRLIGEIKSALVKLRDEHDADIISE